MSEPEGQVEPAADAPPADDVEAPPVDVTVPVDDDDEE